MAIVHTSEIRLQVGLDENRVPEADDVRTRVLSVVGLYLFALNHSAWPGEENVSDMDELCMDWIESTPEDHVQAYKILTNVYQVEPEHLIWH